MTQKPPGNIAFSHYLKEKKFMGSKCSACGAISVPPRPMCNKCFSSDMEWTELAGKGTLESFTCTAVCTPCMAELGYSPKNPYCVGIVKLAEGTNAVALIDGVDNAHPESIEIGMPLGISFRDMNEDEALLVFRKS